MESIRPGIHQSPSSHRYSSQLASDIAFALDRITERDADYEKAYVTAFYHPEKNAVILSMRMEAVLTNAERTFIEEVVEKNKSLRGCEVDLERKVITYNFSGHTEDTAALCRELTGDYPTS